MLQKGFSIPKLIITVLIIGMLGGLSFHTWLSWQPRDLSDIDGISEDAETEEEPVNLNEKLSAALKGQYDVVLTEAEINQYIASRLELSQSSVLDRYITMKGLYVNLLPGKVEVILARRVDYPENTKKDGSKYVGFLPTDQTVTMELLIETQKTDDGTSNILNIPGGRFGKAPAPNQFVKVIKPGFDKVAEFFEEELDLIYNQMNEIRVEDGTITLVPPKVSTENPSH